MAKVTYVEYNGTEHTVDIEDDMTLMEGATMNMVPGLDGYCGGICSCGTCQVYIDPEWQEKIPASGQEEADLIQTVVERKVNSRLGCQVVVTEALDGLVVRLPETQAVLEEA